MYTKILTGLLVLIGTGSPLAGQLPSNRTVPLPSRIEAAIAEVPFGPGEWAEYQVRLGPLSVGSGEMEIVGVEQIRGRPSYHMSWRIRGGIPLARVNDHFQTWMDIETLASRRFIQDIHEVRYRNYRHFEIYPEEQRWQRMDADAGEPLSAPVPLDDIAFIYYVRTLPLEVGETYELDLYFRDDRNPVRLEVLRREQIRVPAGTFNTIVVRPTIQTDGLFGEGGEAEVYFTDDERRLLVRLTSRIPVVGSLSLHLREYRAGSPLRSWARR